ncbi:MAG TPA: nitrite/sulfite reductase [Terriglobia bacterium]|nr:nitrite/sulfite reductase [Terriglobia bacterium]
MEPEKSILVKETKAQRAERLKAAKNPWESFAEIEEFGRKGFDAIPGDWLKTYFRWWGVYTQGDGAGVLGGKGGEGNATPYFMLRIRIPNGFIRAHQLRVVAGIAEKYAHGFADLTVRQNIQLHWITIEALPVILRTLEENGLMTKAACGDDTRNITGCPLAGIDAAEHCDASPLVFEAQKMLVGPREFYNLPRKFKICVTGCPVWCSYPEINDVGLTATVRKLNGRREVGFSLRVGGGLSSQPHLAVRVPAFVRWEQALPVMKGVAEIFRDSDCLRESRERARLKYLFMKHGWTPEQFLAALEERIGFHLDPPEEEDAPADAFRDHVGFYPQKQPGRFYAGVSVLRGRISAVQLASAAELAERYAGGELRITGMQNLIIVNVPKQNADPLLAGLEQAGLPLSASAFRRGAISCTGTEFCKLAITETKHFTGWLVDELERRLPAFSQHLKIDVNGCPNGCGQHWIADIGLEGKRMKLDGKMAEAYYFTLGGAVGKHQALSRQVGYRCAATEVPSAIERLLYFYLAEREEGETFRAFCARTPDEDLRTSLAGEPAPSLASLPSILEGESPERALAAADGA